MVYRKGMGQWWIKSVSRNVQLYAAYPYGGDASDVPATGDYDGDGFADIVVYRTGNGQWNVNSLHRAVQMHGGYPYGGSLDRLPVS